MKRVLIVSPHFPPVNAPDMQRVRLSLPYLRDHGWEPVVLAVAPEMVEGAVMDPLLETTYPADIRIVRVKGLSSSVTRWAGVGNLWWRCRTALTRAGEDLLREEPFDLVFFSTTQFNSFQLGPRWRRKFGVPYVLDYQDPWINAYYAKTGTRPPGGWLKFALSQWTARRSEPSVLREASGIVAVSDSYGHDLAANYPWFRADQVKILPFGASRADFVALGDHRPFHPLVDFSDGLFHHIYAGRCGPDMTRALTALFRGFKLALQDRPEIARRMRFHFIGTDYAPPPLGREWAMPIAQAEGITGYVTEHRYRVPYFDALYYLKNADALLAVGSNDPTYSASKIFPCILAERPLLLIFHKNSLVNLFAGKIGAGMRFCFAGPEDVDGVAAEIYQKWFLEEGYRNFFPVEKGAFDPYTAEFLAGELASVFDAAVARAQGREPLPE